jgi:hypothetical protein
LTQDVARWRETAGTAGGQIECEAMRKVLVLALVLLILLMGLPLALGMSAMTPCPSCPAPDAPIWCGACFAILVWAVLSILVRSFPVSHALAALKPVLFAKSLERPPRVA